MSTRILTSKLVLLIAATLLITGLSALNASTVRAQSGETITEIVTSFGCNSENFPTYGGELLGSSIGGVFIPSTLDCDTTIPLDAYSCIGKQLNVTVEQGTFQMATETSGIIACSDEVAQASVTATPAPDATATPVPDATATPAPSSGSGDSGDSGKAVQQNTGKDLADTGSTAVYLALITGLVLTWAAVEAKNRSGLTLHKLSLTAKGVRSSKKQI